MSEYQYYEFQAIDRPLDKAAQKALRAISTRAQITARSFTNHYEWGDFKGDPRRLMEQWFDVHVYLTNWGTRRLMLRLPGGLVDRKALAPFLQDVDWVEVWESGDSVIVDLFRDDTEVDEEWDDGTRWLAALAPLRAQVAAGDLRLFSLVWLTAVQEERVADAAVEPLPGIGPLTTDLEDCAAFFDIDPDLVQAAAEAGEGESALSTDDLRHAVSAIPESEKTELLLRLLEGEHLVAAELKRIVRKRHPAPAQERRTAGALRRRAQEIAETRERAEAERREAERRRQSEQAERERRARLAALKQRGAAVWREIEAEISRRNAGGYDRAASLLCDLQTLAAEEGSLADFGQRLSAIRKRHQAKRRFIERLAGLARSHGGTAA